MSEVRVDCFAYKKDLRKCVALNQLYCAKENCRFYKPKPGEANRRVRHTAN